MKFIKEELQELHNKSFYRTLKTGEGVQGKYVRVNGKELLSFCSNNYLDLANHHGVIRQ